MERQAPTMSKDFGKYRVDVYSDPEKGGQLMIWARTDENDLTPLVKSDDREWDCISARLFSSAGDAEDAYNRIVSEDQIDAMMLRCGFGKTCV